MSSTPSAGASAPAYAITERGPHHRVWTRVTWLTNELKEVLALTNSYTEVQTGLHYWQSGQWLESRPVILPVPGGAVAPQSQHQVTFAANLNTQGAMTLTTPDGKTLSSHILGLSYFDTASGQAVLLAMTQDSLGWLVGENQVLYTNAFKGEGVKADVQYLYTKAGLEQNVILRVAPPPPDSLRLNPATTRLQVLTEFFNPPVPTQTTGTVADGAPDTTLDFGAMQIGPGRAFLAGTRGTTNVSTVVTKQWVVVSGRTFLVESVPYSRVAAQMAALPAKNASGSLFAARGHGPDVVAALADCLPAASVSRTANDLQLARTESAVGDGFVIDYTVLTSQPDFTFQGDMTYYVSGPVILSGTTTIEGGAVIKFTNRWDAGLSIWSTLSCATAPYRMAILTSKDDDTVGEAIQGSMHTPNNSNGATYLSHGAFMVFSTQLKYLRFCYAGVGAIVTASPESGINQFPVSAVSHCQFVGCRQALGINTGVGTFLAIFNDLFAQCGVVTSVSISPGRDPTLLCEHVTADGGAFNDDDWDTVTVVNSILTDCPIVGSPSVAYTAISPTSAGFYQNVGEGSYYLADNMYRNAGTPSIDPGLLADLKHKTTQPPTELDSVFATDTTLGLNPLVGRDTGAAPDYGYHYDPLDYVVSGQTVSAKLTLVGGVVLGTYGGSATSGLSIGAGGNVISLGTPTHLNHIVRYNTVQEQATGAWSAPTVGAGIRIAHGSAQAQFRFTSWSLLAANGDHCNCSTIEHPDPVVLMDCQLAGGNLILTRTSANLTNCLWERVAVRLNDIHRDPNHFLFNNTFFGGTLNFNTHNGAGINRAEDNFFDHTVIAGRADVHGHNGYIVGQSRLQPPQGSDQTLTTAQYAAGPLGAYYYTGATLNTLENNGSRSVADASLSGYTVRVDQTPDSGQVDIGFHYKVLPACPIRPGFDSSFLIPNDDNEAVPNLLATLPFAINYYLSTYSQLYVNNNGNVTFTDPVGQYTPTPLVNMQMDIIAPFWADVDTRNTDSDVVRYGSGTVDGSPAFGVNWVNVGYFYEHADELISVQLVLIDRSAGGQSGDFDLEMNYCTVQWEAGDRSGGSGGFWVGPGGSPARAGFASAGGSSFEFSGSGSPLALLDLNFSTGLRYRSFNSSLPGRYVFQFRGGIPQATP